MFWKVQHKFWIFLAQTMRVIIVWKMAHRIIRNLDSNYVSIEGRKYGSLMFFFHGFGFIISYLYLETNPGKINFLEKNTLVLVIHKTKLFWKCVEKWHLVTVLTITFERWGILWRGLYVLESGHSELEFNPNFEFFWHKSWELLLFEKWPNKLSQI